MNLRDLALAAERLTQERPPIVVDGWQCLRARDKSADCTTCADSCPVAAISLDGGVQVDAETCVRCGLCLHRCPAGVFDGRDGVYKLLHCVSQISAHETVELACSAHPEPATGAPDVDAVISIRSCLSALGPSAYVGLLALGVRQVRVRLDACDACPLGTLKPEIEREITRTQTLLAPLGYTDAVEVAADAAQQQQRPVYSTQDPPVSRRGFFRTLARQHVVSVDDIQLPDEPQIDGERSAPRERRRLVNGLRFLGAEAADEPVAMDGFARLGISDGCNACGMCARVCPTGALTVETDNDHFEVLFAAAQCTACGICTRFCSPGVLKLYGAPTYTQLLAPEVWVLHEADLAQCARCGADYAPPSSANMCPVCAERRRSPFATRIPEEVRQRLEAVRAGRS